MKKNIQYIKFKVAIVKKKMNDRECLNGVGYFIFKQNNELENLI